MMFIGMCPFALYSIFKKKIVLFFLKIISELFCIEYFSEHTFLTVMKVKKNVFQKDISK